MNLSLQIAGLNILIVNYPFPVINNRIRCFIHDFTRNETDILCSVEIYDMPPEILGELKLVKSNRQFYKGEDSLTFVYKMPYAKGEIVYYTIFYPKTNICRIYMPKNYMDANFNEKLFLSILSFSFFIINHSRIMIHSSVIKYESEAILFSGPSGIGKSTQALLWKNIKNSDILNGDRGILHIKDNDIDVYGSPFAGSSNIYLNISAPVKAIVLLEKGVHNTMERLKPQWAYKYLYPRFAIPNWDEEWTIECVNLIERIMELIPIYRLSCTPDERAVDILYKELFSDVI